MVTTITGTSFDEVFQINNGEEVHVFAGNSDDVISARNAGIAQQQIEGGPLHDLILMGSGSDIIFGDNASDGEGNKNQVGSFDRDYILAGGNRDIVYGQGGDDVISGENGDDSIMGGIGNDFLMGGTGIDDVHGGAGNDIIFGGNAAPGDIPGFSIDVDHDGRTGQFIHANHTPDHYVGPSPIDGGTTGTGDDSLFGNEGNDKIFGQDGHDFIVGGKGKDRLSGGPDSDTFHYDSRLESFGRNHDIITDFSHAEGDHIELQVIDANTKKGGDQAFHFIGGAAFHGKAGELHLIRHGKFVTVEADVNGDGKADFQIDVHNTTNNLHNLVKGDFVL